MPQITVWKCPISGKIFEDRQKYSQHLLNLRQQRSIKRKISADSEKLNNWFTCFRAVERNIEELKTAVIDNQEMFWKAAASKNTHDWSIVGVKQHKKVTLPIPILVEFTEFNFTWSPLVSNTHDCPVGGVNNWYRKSDLPSGYPGWFGSIAWKVKCPPEWSSVYIGSDLFDGTLIHKGSGGGGSYDEKTGCQKFSYTCRIYAHDWPGLYAGEMRKHALNKINQNRQDVWNYVGGNSTVTPITTLPSDWVAPELEKL